MVPVTLTVRFPMCVRFVVSRRSFPLFCFGGHSISKVDQHKVSLSDGTKLLGRQSHRVSNGISAKQSLKTQYGQKVS